MKPETRSFYAQAVQRAIEHVTSHLDEALALEPLAAQACLSPFHFHRVFRGMIGETPMELIRRLRMERAAWQLGHTDRPVTGIAFDAGYETHEAFTRAFREWYGTSPSGYRQRNHRRIELAAPCGVHFQADGRVPAFIPHDSGGSTMDVEIKMMPELRVGAVHHIGPYNQISTAFERLGQIAGRAGWFADPVEMVALYHDDPETTPSEQLQSDAAIVLPKNTLLPEGITEIRIPAGEYASALHVGPYEQLGDAWARFMGEWLPASTYRFGGGVSYEVYLNNPMQVPKEQLRTEMRIPITHA